MEPQHLKHKSRDLLCAVGQSSVGRGSRLATRLGALGLFHPPASVALPVSISPSGLGWGKEFVTPGGWVPLRCCWGPSPGLSDSATQEHVRTKVPPGSVVCGLPSFTAHPAGAGCGSRVERTEPWASKPAPRGRATRGGRAIPNDESQHRVLVGARGESGVWGPLEQSVEVHSCGPNIWLCYLPAGKGSPF